MRYEKKMYRQNITFYQAIFIDLVLREGFIKQITTLKKRGHQGQDLTAPSPIILVKHLLL